MRFCLIYQLKTSDFPLNYREDFMSLLKSALKLSNNELYKKLFNDRIIKPYTWAIRFDRRPIIQNGSFKIGHKLNFYFSINSSIIGTYVYNGLILMKEFPLSNGNKIVQSKAIHIDDKKINSYDVTFYTLSPIIIRQYNKSNYTILPDQQEFDLSMKESILRQWKYFTNQELDLDFKFTIKKWKKAAVNHYGGIIFGFYGIIRAESGHELLNLLYQIGFGHRRSQGFGMMEIEA